MRHIDAARRAGQLHSRFGRSAVKGTALGATTAIWLAGMAAPAGAAEATGNCGAPAGPGKVTCVYDNPNVTNYVFRVPAGVTEVRILARGAGGGSGGTIDPRVPPAEGGPGGEVAASFPTTGGQLLRILVGGHGSNADGVTPGAAGLNGGAGGGAGAPGGGGGGGASSVWLRGSDPGSRILVAGGGGGAGGALSGIGFWSSGGGAGGGLRGEDGGGELYGQGGEGAVGSSGGAGLQKVSGLDGHSGYDAPYGGGGGEGGYGTSNTLKHSGTWEGGAVGAGGGGGGYAGGSGGAAGAMVGGGGGGGSGFVSTVLARTGSEVFSMGENSTGRGQVVITYRVPTDRHDRSRTAVPANMSAATTSDQRE